MCYNRFNTYFTHTELKMLSHENIVYMKNFSKNYAYPIATSYTKWILNDCIKNGHKKIYFLARDGYILYKIAKIICKQANLDIDCRYLYCSRFSLRLPAYSLMQKEDLNKNLFNYVNNFNPMIIFKKINATEKQINELSSCLDIKDIYKTMDIQEHKDFISKLKNSQEFFKILSKNSNEAYKTTIGYFKQEKLFQDKEIVFADLGWYGSMQQCISLLIKSEKYTGNLKGYYWGLYNKIPQEYGISTSFYFDHDKYKWRKILFNVNLFECIFSANHGMTLGYQLNNKNVFVPILNAHNHKKMNELIEIQIDEILKQTISQVAALDIENFNIKKENKNNYKLIKKFIVHPTKEICNVFENYVMCEDTTENYHHALTSKELTKTLKSQLISHRIINKLLKKKNNSTLLWAYGVVAYQPLILRPWYRFNLILIEYLRFIINDFC